MKPKFINSNQNLAKSNEEIIQLFLNCVYQFANFAKKLDFFKQVQECNLDAVIVILTVIIVLLNPERNQLINFKHIIKEQELYLDLLEKYMQWKYGLNLASTLFAKLLMTLPNLRELAELFS